MEKEIEIIRRYLENTIGLTNETEKLIERISRAIGKYYYKRLKENK